MASVNPGLDIDAILKKTEVKKDPVISYGILEFTTGLNQQGQLCAYFHVFRRRHTIEYGVLIQGYAQRNQLYDLISLLSRDERDRILNNDWEDLWDDYWIDHACPTYTSLQAQSRRRFPEIKAVLQLIDADVPCRIGNRPYIFPKGRPDKNESGLHAALREAHEETRTEFNLNDNSTPTNGELYFNDPIIQHYRGSDTRPYTDYYYVWKRPQLYSCQTQKLSTIKHVRTSSKTVNLDDLNKSEERSPYNIVCGRKTPNPEGESPEQVIREETPRLRKRTISHELESDAWLEIPIFNSNRQRLEWIATIDPYEDYGIFRRHFQAIMEVHSHLCQTR